MHLRDELLDAHFHLLQEDVAYPWMDAVTATLKDFTQAELEDEFQANAVVGGVVVQAVSDVRETKALLGIAATNSKVLGVVGWIDLTSPTIDDDLASLLGWPGSEKLVGIRHQTHDEVDPLWLRRPDVLHGLDCVAAEGLTFDLLIRQREIPAARELAATLPGLTLVVDHLAKPVPNREELSAWTDALASLAAYPNTYCKLSGLVTEVTPLRGWTSEQLRPFLDVGLDAFGPHRCMFGSDWPVCELAASYTQVVELVTGALESHNPLDRSGVLFRNAMDVYNLSLDRHVF
jgi:L-fuconolactonase